MTTPQRHMLRIAPFAGGAKQVKIIPTKAPEFPPENIASIERMTRTPGEGTQQQFSDFVRFFRHFGVLLNECRTTGTKRQLKGDCPLPTCRKPDHFFIDPNTGLWDCKKCVRTGNIYNFIRLLHEQYFSLTDDSNYESLKAMRPGINVSSMKKFKLALNTQTNEWMIPSMNYEGEIVNLHIWRDGMSDDGTKQWRQLIGCPSIKHTIFGLQFFDRKDMKTPVRVLEGHWDHLAMDSILSNMGGKVKFQTIGMPGAGVFPSHQMGVLTGREVGFLLDNDESGKNGTDRCLGEMARTGITPTRLYSIEWPNELTEGYDIRELSANFTRNRPDPLSKFPNPINFIQKHLQPRRLEDVKSDNEGYDPNVVAHYCPSFDSLIGCCSDKLHVTKGFESTFAYALALNIAVSLGGGMVWGHIVGPPSSGKTTIVELMETAHPYVYSTSKLTGLFSGFKSKGKEDHGMIKRINNKLVAFKDLTTILNGPPAVQDKLFNDLRDSSDGSASTQYMNGQGYDYNNIRFGIVTAVTQIIRSWNQNRTALGERFIFCEIDSEWSQNGTMSRINTGSIEHNRISVDNQIDAICNIDEPSTKIDYSTQKGMTWGLLDHLHAMIADNKDYIRRLSHNIKTDRGLQDYVTNLSSWSGLARTAVERDNFKDIAYRPRPEVSSRLNNQLIKMTIALCIIFQLDHPDDVIMSLIRKYALDTAIGFPLEIMLALAHCTKDAGMTADSLSDEISLSKSTTIRRLDDLKEIGIIRSGQVNANITESSTGIRLIRTVGRPVHWYRLTPEIKSLATALGFC